MLKGTGKILSVISAATFFSLLYVHGQTALFRLSYEMEDQAGDLSRKSDAYLQLAFEVEQLKAPRLLEERMKELKLDLTLPSEIQVVKIPEVPSFSGISHPEIAASSLLQGWGDFFGRWIKVAQAKTDS